jgi:hypothetical protein
VSATTQRRRRASHALFATSLLLGLVAAFLPVLAGSAEARVAVEEGAVHRTVTAGRVFYDEAGSEIEAGSHDVSLDVAQTTNLRGRQEIHVSWSGAIPTGGLTNDPNSADGRLQEYPFVLLQCRGVDTTGSVPKGQVRLSPETCWTGTTPERYLSAASHTPAWRFDAYATEAERRPVVGAPDPLPQKCVDLGEPLTARWLPFRAAGGEVYQGGPDPDVGCVNMAPETDNSEAGGLPTNTTYGITRPDGTGETDFAVWTAAENASLGCSATVQCALVAVPIVGTSCDAWGTKLPTGSPQTTKAGVPLTANQKANADATCRRTGAYLPGQARSSTLTDQAVRGNLWWSASNWRNRMTVPLTFAQTGAVCDAVSAEKPQEIMGSVALNELTASWRPTFCTSKDLFTFTHVQQSDALARTLVDVGEIDAAFATAPKEGGYTSPVVQAPLAVGGFGIAFTIDGVDKQRRETLNLNARLVAKLLSQSYPAAPVVKNNHPSIGGNPFNITLDPEFQALNPGLPVTSDIEAAAALQTFSSSSDLLWALTSWLDADPEARAFLDGYPDPWGMKVNDNYRDIDLPVDNWPLKDDFIAPEYYQETNACYGKSPTPFMQLIANPASSLSTVVLNMQFGSSAVQTVCRFDGSDATQLALKTQGRQPLGFRFVLGLVSLSAAERYNLRLASLQTLSTVSPSTQFTDPAGRFFADPDRTGMKAAAALLEADTDAGQWALDYEAISTGDGAKAYPGLMPIYAVVPTEGLEAKTATRLGKLLCYSDKQGQEPGLANGQLPGGYLPLTKANGLGTQRDYVLSAVAAIKAQGGDVPALDAEAPSRDEACDFSRTSSPTPTPTPTPTASPTATTPPITTPDVPVAPLPTESVPVASESPSAAPSAQTPVVQGDVVLTSGQTSDLGRLGVPLLVIIAMLSALGGSLLRWYDAIAPAFAALRSRPRKGAKP